MFRVDIDAFHEVGRRGHDMYLAPFARLCLQNAVRSEDEHRIFFDFELLKIEQSGGFAFGPHSDDEGIDTARETECLQAGFRTGGDAFARQSRSGLAAGHGDQFLEGYVVDRSFRDLFVHDFFKISFCRVKSYTFITEDCAK